MEIDALSPLNAQTWLGLLKLTEHLMSYASSLGRSETPESPVIRTLHARTAEAWSSLLTAPSPEWALAVVDEWLSRFGGAIHWGLPPGVPDGPDKDRLGILGALTDRFMEAFTAEAKDPTLAPQLVQVTRDWQVAHGATPRALSPGDPVPGFIERGLRS